MVIEFIDTDGRFIKQWPNAEDFIIPQKGDTVVIHWGDYHEDKEVYKVVDRIINGTESNKLYLKVGKVKAPLTEELMESLHFDPLDVSWFKTDDGFYVSAENGGRKFLGTLHTTDELRQALVLCNIKRYEL